MAVIVATVIVRAGGAVAYSRGRGVAIKASHAAVEASAAAVGARGDSGVVEAGIPSTLTPNVIKRSDSPAD